MPSAARTERPAAREQQEEKDRASRPEPQTAPAAVLALQRQIGNRALANVLARGKHGQTKKKGGGGKKRGGGGKKPPGGDSVGTVTEPKKKKDPIAEKVAGLRSDATRESTRANRSANHADGHVVGATKAHKDVQALLQDPMVAANADVKASIEGAERDADAERGEAVRQAGVARLKATDAVRRADEVHSTEPDLESFGEPTAELAESLRKARNIATEAEQASDRAEAALKRAHAALGRAERARDLVAHAKTWVAESGGDADTKARNAISTASKWNINSDKLQTLRAQARKPVVDEQWRDRRSDVKALDAEAERVLGFVSLLDEAETRAGSAAMPHAQKMAVRALITAARLELQKSTRDDVEAGIRLTAIGDKLDELDDAAAVAAGTADARNALIAEGRLAQNRTVIAAEARSGLAGAEATAVAQILDAHQAGAAASPFGGAWDAYHGNNAGDLPGMRGGGGYTEFYVRRLADDNTGFWGSRRLVRHTNSGRWYFSRTHYGANGAPAFVLLTA